MEVTAGLAADRPTLPCKLFYDETGSRLFDQITEQPEYYPTRAELSILSDCRGELAEAVGAGVTLIEYGSGNPTKIELLLGGLDVAAYVPIDISRYYLETAAERLAELHPKLAVRPVLADYNQVVPLPHDLPGGPRVGFFPGGTIGNFTRENAAWFLSRVAKTLGPGGFLVLGADRPKDPAILHAAYNDAAGVTAAFNLNLLHRLNRELDAGFTVDRWRHYALYNPGQARIEMHLVTVADETVTVAGREFAFAEGDSIHTENSCKYTPARLGELAKRSGFALRRQWTDADKLFGVYLLQVA